MSKQAKILLAICILAIIAVFYLFFSLKQVTVTAENAKKIGQNFQDNFVEKVSQQQMEENYMTGIKPFIDEYGKFLEAVSSTTGKTIQASSLDSSSSTSAFASEEEVLKEIANLKVEIMGYTVPEQFRGMHMDLVMSLTSLKSFFETKTADNKDKAMDLFAQAKNEFNSLQL
jgi:hypothetical protein